MAESLRWWLPKVVQGVKPFVSAKDIDKGSNWTSALETELQTTDFGIVCLAADNLQSPWLHYEVGALSKSVESRVCPLLYGISKGDVNAPLNQLQLTDFDIEDVRLMMQSVNKGTVQPLTDEHLNEAVDMWWPRLESKFADLPGPAEHPTGGGIEPNRPALTESDMFGEILSEVRSLRSEIRPSKKPLLTARAKTSGDLLMLLNEYDLRVSEAIASSDSIAATVDSVPESLPGNLYSLLGEFARRNKKPVHIRGLDATSISFDANGYSDQPPF